MALGRAIRSSLFFDLDRLGADKNSTDLKKNRTVNSDLSLIQYNNNKKKILFIYFTSKALFIYLAIIKQYNILILFKNHCFDTITTNAELNVNGENDGNLGNIYLLTTIK